MNSSMYSPTDLQEIILDDHELLKLISTYKSIETVVYGNSLYSGGGLVYDQDGNSYTIRFDLKDKKYHICIGKAFRTFESVEEYRLWCNILEKCSIINSFIEYDKQLEAERNKSFWSKLYEFFS